MQDENELLWTQQKYGWQSLEPENAKAENKKSSVTQNAIASKVPYIKTLQKAKETAQKAIDVVKENIERSKAADERYKRESGEQTPKSIYLFVGIIISIIIFSGGFASSLMGSLPYLFAPAFSTPAVLTQLEQESQLVDVAKRELAEAADNIGGQKYKDWYGINGNWCAMFVSYCANECGYLEDDIMPKSASVLAMSNWYKERDLWKDASDYIPKAGDIIFFQNDMSHVGIVTGYDSETKIITTIEGNTGSVDTTIEHNHNWQLSTCAICGGDHLTAETEICATCQGNGYILTKFGTANVYGDCSSIMKYTGCGSCGGSGTMTDYYNKYGCAFSEGSIMLGTGTTKAALVCMGCYNFPEFFGKASKCLNDGCIYSESGAWTDYPEGVCYTTVIDYHEGSTVLEKRYPLTYVKISGYGLPEYPYEVKDNEN